MADELRWEGQPGVDTGLTVTANLVDSVGAQVASGISCIEGAAGAIYIGDMPTQSAGVYEVRFFSSGSYLNSGVIYWDGSAEIDLLSIDGDTSAIKAKTDQLTFTVPNQVDSNCVSGGGSNDY